MFRHICKAAFVAAVLVLAVANAQTTLSYHTDAGCTADNMVSYQYEYRSIACTESPCTEALPGRGYALYTRRTCGAIASPRLGVVTDNYSSRPAFGSTTCNGTKDSTTWTKTGVCIPVGVRSSSSSFKYSVSGGDSDSTIVVESCDNADCTACTRTESYKNSKTKCNSFGSSSYYGVSSATKNGAMFASLALVLLACVFLM